MPVRKSKPKGATALTHLKLDEISFVDFPAQEGATVLFSKAKGAVPGAADVRAALVVQAGEDAALDLDAAINDATGVIRKALQAGHVETVSPMVAALAESIASSYAGFPDTADEAERAEAVDVAKAQFAEDMEAVASVPVDGVEDRPSPAVFAKALAAAEDEPFSVYAEFHKRAAVTFGEMVQHRAERELLSTAVYTLDDSLRSILSDPEVKDKATLMRQSLTDFDAYVSGVIKNTGKAGGKDDAVTEKTTPVQKSAQDERMDAMETELASFRKADAFRKAQDEARTLLPNGGPVDEVAHLLVDATTPEAKARVTAVAKAMGEQAKVNGNGGFFGTVGSVTKAADAPESPVVAAVRKAHPKAGQARA